MHDGKSTWLFRRNINDQNEHLKKIMKLIQMAFSFRYPNETLVQEPPARVIGPGVCSSSNIRQSLNQNQTPTAEHVNTYIDLNVS